MLLVHWWLPSCQCVGGGGGAAVMEVVFGGKDGNRPKCVHILDVASHPKNRNLWPGGGQPLLGHKPNTSPCQSSLHGMVAKGKD
ncbi:hypothetical protein E2C01_006040 [Portunus trituberculatus]|uniref:Secreted protein n=1 Tax=Portunus trituberculatus TaxID=210409 RepID=A0A5B7CVU0_PORTR|nr:hypothetical protein [Portunus trituberculatus]